MIRAREMHMKLAARRLASSEEALGTDSASSGTTSANSQSVRESARNQNTGASGSQTSGGGHGFRYAQMLPPNLSAAPTSHVAGPVNPPEHLRKFEMPKEPLLGVIADKFTQGRRPARSLVAWVETLCGPVRLAPPALLLEANPRIQPQATQRAPLAPFAHCP